MLLEIARYEIAYRARRSDTYLYFATLLLLSLVAVDFVFEGRLGIVKENAPYVIAVCMSIYTAFFMLIVSMIMGVAILRDYQHGMAPFIFTKPITKQAYFLGRWLGAFVVVLFVFTGILWGMMLGEFMPWRDAADLLPFNAWHYFQPFLFIVVPTLFMGGAVFFVGGTLSKKMLVVYTQGIFFLVAYLVAMIATRDAADPFWGSLLDPFGFELVGSQVRFMTPEERNVFDLPINGILLLNRSLWLAIGALALGVGYRLFSFREKNKARPQVQGNVQEAMRSSAVEHLEAGSSIMPTVTPQHGGQTAFVQLFHTAWFHFRSLLREVSFWAIVASGAAIIFVNGITVGTTYGVDSFPVTYLVIEELEELSIGFFLIVLVFYSGELIWKEKGLKANALLDAYPVATASTLAGKFFALVLIYLLLIGAMILSGVGYQLTKGYSDFDLSLYFSGFGFGILHAVVLFTAVSFFFHTLTNSKTVGFLATILFVVLTVAAPLLGLHHPLLRFGSSNLGTYSAMNGYGHSLVPFGWYTLYWTFFVLLLFLLAIRLFNRGQQANLLQRWASGRKRFTRPMAQFGIGTSLLFLCVGGYIFYNTNVLNRYYSPAEGLAFRAGYEQTLKKYEHLPQPKIVAVDLQTDLYPEERDYRISGTFTLKNTSSLPITEIHLQKNPDSRIVLEQLAFSVANTPDTAHFKYGYCIYVLAQKMLPGDSLTLSFTQTLTSTGFQDSDDTDLVANGTFFSNDHLPSLGYNQSIELEDNDDREDHNLPPNTGRAERTDDHALQHGSSRGDSDKIRFEMVLSTSADQTAIAPGNLVREWKEGPRNFFHYRMDQPMINFYSIVSARYAVRRETWVPPTALADSVSLEIFHHPGHEHNLDRMMKALHTSLSYFSAAFSPYQYGHIRIAEFPRYRAFAQSFPGTIPFSESLGFILDIDDAEDVDMASLVTAHELAHQWWGMQLVAANVEGRHLLLESLAHYSALMVIREMYSDDAVRQFLSAEMSQYLQARAASQRREVPLAEVDDQSHIYYKKGAVNLYALQDYISEDSVNQALSNFLADWNFIDGPPPNRPVSNVGRFTRVFPSSYSRQFAIRRYRPL